MERDAMDRELFWVIVEGYRDAWVEARRFGTEEEEQQRWDEYKAAMYR